VREVGRGNGMEERSLEIEVLRGGGRRWWRQEAGLHIFCSNINKMVTMIKKAAS